MDLINKKILFFGVSFFGYENKMIEQIIKLGGEVIYYNERSVTSALGRAFLKISPYIFYLKTIQYYKNILSKHKNEKFDYIFFWSTDMVFGSVIKEIKKCFPKTPILQYQSDSVVKKKLEMNTMKFFDRIITYDKSDYKILERVHENVQFRPLFYIDDYLKKKENTEFLYDLSFIGTIHSDRYEIINKIENQIKNKNMNIFFHKYLQSWFIYYYYKFTNKSFRNSKKSDFNYNKLDSTIIASIYNMSNVILDIQYPKNNGLTMRTIETLAAGKKIITTNKDIKSYNFYDENLIQVINRDNVLVNYDFFDTECPRVGTDFYKNYSIEQWVKDIFLYDKDEYKTRKF